MKVYRFRQSDVASMDKWIAAQGLPGLKTECCEIGFIVKGVAACFMLRAENGVAIMDSLVSNPLVSSKTRHMALDALFAAIKQKSVDLGYSRLIGFTSSEAVLVRAMNHGFKPQPHIILSLETK